MSIGNSYLHPVWFVRYVGWVGKKVPRRGVVPPTIMQVLRHHHDHSYVEDGLLGCHTCEICGKGDFHGEFVVRARSAYYVLPVGIFHYIEEHGYCPPYQFIKAIAPSGTALERTRAQKWEIVSDVRDFMMSMLILPLLFPVAYCLRRLGS
ncbi:MAG TPA: hypothetical protein VNN22_15835 [Verrucomicrobiae bacterium]|nr:hypothetical protein [Verrucomicrobiae bacterium]